LLRITKILVWIKKHLKSGLEYPIILIDSDKICFLNMTEVKRNKKVSALFFFELNEQKKQSQIERVNADMWKP